MDIEEKEFQTPKIVINYDSLKTELEKSLADYKGLVVTAETLPACKEAQKELSSLRTKIDKYRKEKKKELEKPIKQFEVQCKELIALVEQAEQPIKDGIKVFDDLKREEKKKVALKIIEKTIVEYGLTVRYANALDVLPKYMNLTATKKEVKEDIENRAFALKLEQDREKEQLDILQAVIDVENQRLKTKMDINLFQTLINTGTDTGTLVKEIKLRADVIFKAENKPIEQKKDVEPTPEPPQTQKPQNEPVQQYTATYKISGSAEQLKSVSGFLKANGISYEVLDQRILSGVM